MYGVFIFVADSILFMYFVAYMSFVSNGIYFLIGPLLIAEYFGDKYFGINYGATYLADGCFTLFLQFILGLLYDLNVIDKSSHNCYGLHCYSVSSGILFALSIATLSTCVTLYMRRQRQLLDVMSIFIEHFCFCFYSFSNKIHNPSNVFVREIVTPLKLLRFTKMRKIYF